MCEKYNGWSNRETWATVLHLNNDVGLYRTVQDWAVSNLQEQENEAEAVTVLAESIEDFVTELVETDWDGVKFMRYDIGSLWRVNWREVAESFISEMLVK
jgi:hypothetical protein